MERSDPLGVLCEGTGDDAQKQASALHIFGNNRPQRLAEDSLIPNPARWCADGAPAQVGDAPADQGKPDKTELGSGNGPFPGFQNEVAQLLLAPRDRSVSPGLIQAGIGELIEQVAPLGFGDLVNFGSKHGY